MDLSDKFPLKVEEAGAAKRLDQFLAELFPDVSRSRWSRLIKEGFFSISGKSVDSSHKLRLHDEIHCSQTSFAENTDLRKLKGDVQFLGQAPQLIFEDDDILVLNKACGLTVHPGNGTPLENTVVGWLLQEKKIEPQSWSHFAWGEQILERARPGIVHRLDKSTSGALVVAKNPAAHSHLSKQFATRTAGRLYWAVVRNGIEDLRVKFLPNVEEHLKLQPCPVSIKRSEQGKWSVATYLVRDPAQRTRFKVSKILGQGKRAVTHFVTLGENNKFALLELKLETGRTHQIRVHLNFLQHAILGDSVYGGSPHGRLMLHAHTLHILHPRSEKALTFEAEFGPEEKKWLDQQSLVLKSREDLWNVKK